MAKESWKLTIVFLLRHLIAFLAANIYVQQRIIRSSTLRSGSLISLDVFSFKVRSVEVKSTVLSSKWTERIIAAALEYFQRAIAAT